MSGRFTLAGLLMGVTLVALVLAIVVAPWRAMQRELSYADVVFSLAASADGSTFGVRMGDGKILIWDGKGTPKLTRQTQGDPFADFALSCDGRFVAVEGECMLEGAQQQGGAVWEVATGRLLRALPPSLMGLAFSPTEPVLAITDGAFIEFLDFRHDASLGGMAAEGSTVGYSADGRMLAVGAASGHVQIYDASTRKLLKNFGGPDGTTRLYSDPAWARDPVDWKLMALRVASMNERGVVALAVGQRGDTFMTVRDDGIDLWDVATLQPRQRLWRARSPSVWLPVAGLVAWSAWFGAHRARKRKHTCETYGRSFQPTGRKDTSVDCLACRQKAEATPAGAVRR